MLFQEATEERVREISNAIGDNNSYVGDYQENAKVSRDLDDTLSYKREWYGSHKGVRFSISHHGVSTYSPNGTWCYYVHINEEQVDQDFFDEFLWLETREIDTHGKVRYVTNDRDSIMHNVEWHSGITFYRKKTEHDTWNHKNLRTVTVGCDFAHLWDREYGQDKIYTLGYILSDAKRTCEELIGLFNIKVHCNQSGVYVDRKYTIEYEGKVVTPAQLGAMSSYRYKQGVKAREELEQLDVDNSI